ncbi:MAG: polysaccharide biosynthesis protein [Bacteroidetes bacterium]|nr:polysaccharide biosynthesis protein [Candidatus Colenecus caballi]
MTDESGCTQTNKVSPSGKIAKNTFLLWGRMLILTVINLFSLRILLKALGDDDYGLYNAVAGVVTLFSSVTTVLSISTQRFYSYESGKGNYSKLNEIFSKSLNLNALLSLLIVLLLETAGLWYVGTLMEIPDGRMEAVQWTYQFAVISLVFMLLQIPFMAAVLAHEDMGIYTVITTVECLLKLAVIYLIGTSGIDGMIFYGAGLLVVVLLTFLSYVFVAVRRYPECHYHVQKSRSLYRELLTFSGWTFYGSVAGVALIQGNTLLLNRFFKPFINAAFAVAVQINNAFTQLCGSVVLAIRPAMIRSYAANDYDGLAFLFSFCNKILFFIVSLIGIPLIIEMPTVMYVWLEDVVPEKILFARLMIVYVMVMAMHNPITTIMQASGNIKKYHLLADTIILMCIPLSYLLFMFGMPAYFILVTMTAVSLIAHVVRMFCLKRQFDSFSLYDYLVKFLLPFILYATVSFAVSFLFHRMVGNMMLRFVSVLASSVLTLSLPIWGIGLSVEEKAYVKSFFHKRKE